MKSRNFELLTNTIAEYCDFLVKKDYNNATIKRYQSHFKRFLNCFQGVNPKFITDEQIRRHLLHLAKEKGYSISAQNQAISAIKLYYKNILDKKIDDYYFPRQKKEKLPVVLSKNEIKKILNCATNLKHKAILSTIYSAGLRLSEVVNLKIADIDNEKMLIIIKGGKEKKSRNALLSKELLMLLKMYFKEYKPKIWLFENPNWMV